VQQGRRTDRIRHDCPGILTQSSWRHQLYAEQSHRVGVCGGSQAVETAGFGAEIEAKTTATAVAAEAGAQIKKRKEFATESGMNRIDPFFSYSL
jgi:hypothetical protein